MLRVMQFGESTIHQSLFKPHARILNIGRSTVEGYARISPATSKWTKHTIAEHVSIGGNGPLHVGTPSQVADGLETWIKEADVDGFNFVSTSEHEGGLS